MKKFIYYCVFGACLHTGIAISQNECSKWYFGFNAALDFMSNPPSQPGNSAMAATNAAATIADASGNLLFYTNGTDVWNSAHTLMANGNSITNTTLTRTTLIVKQPGSNSYYYIFTISSQINLVSYTLSYSVADMTLAAGLGSVTAKNLILEAGSGDKMCAVKHCNQQDYWIVTLDATGTTYKCYLLSNTGLQLTPVVSTTAVTPIISSNIGQLEASPNGSKLATAVTASFSATSVSLSDFNSAIGTVSNQNVLHDTIISGNHNYAHCEFSPDGSKVYATTRIGKIFQWDLCHTNLHAIKQSKTLVADIGPLLYSIQLAPDGKIYTSGNSQQTALGVINQPNAVGLLSNFVPSTLTITSGSLNGRLPDFPNHYFFQKKPLPFTNTLSCRTASFEPSPLGCGAPPVDAYLWDFGEQQVPSQNTSTLQYPVHSYITPGIYTVTLVRQFACYSDTISQTLTVSAVTPTLQITAPNLICRHETHTLSVSGANSYVWNNNHSGNQLAISHSVSGTHIYSVTGIDSVGCVVTDTVALTVSICSDLEKLNVLAGFKIYPNPVHNNMHIECDEELELMIYDQLSKKLKTEKISRGKNVVDLKIYDAGIYYLQFKTTEGKIGYYKIVKCE